MKKLIVALLAVLSLGALAASAFAGNGNTVYLCNGKQIYGTGNNRCLVDSENEGVLQLEDTEAVLGAPAGVECKAGEVFDEGWVGPGSEDEVTTVTFVAPKTNCTGTHDCTTFDEVKALDLPWATLLFLAGTESFVLISPTTNGEPGYLVECTVLGVTKDDVCKTTTGETASVPVVNLLGIQTELPLLTATFLEVPHFSATELAECSLSKALTGLVFGAELLEALEGGVQVSLEISEE